MSDTSATILNPELPRPRAAVGRQTVHGTIRVFLAEALILPTGLVTAAFLTRKLGLENYGLFTLATVVVVGIELTITSVFSRAVIKFAAEADDWRPVATTVVRLHLWVSCAIAALLLLFAGRVAQLLEAPTLAPYLRLLSLDIPIVCFAQAQRNIIIGLGGFGQRALGGAARCIARLIFIIFLVQIGLSIYGAILGNMIASLFELAVYRYYTPAPIFTASTFPVKELFGFAVPLFMASISARLFEKLDLMLFKHLGGTLKEAGVYGAAQNLSIIPGIIATSFTPLLLSTLTRVMRSGDRAHASDMARDSIRGALLLFPAAGVVAGSATEIVVLIFGPKFAGAATPLSWLMFGGLGMLLQNVAASVLIAGNKPGWTFALSGPMVPLAIVGHYLFIPHYGSTGAAAVTAVVGCASALASVIAVYALWRTAPSPFTWLRTGVVTFGAYLMTALWPMPGLLVVVKLTVAMIAVGVALLVLGEFDRREIGMVRSIVGTLLSRKTGDAG